MEIYQYKDYDEYVRIQTETHNEKRNWVYAKPRVIEAIVKSSPFAGSILCHGVRNGRELIMFMGRLPYAQVVGTEIAEGCEELFEHSLNQFGSSINKSNAKMVQWDMQNDNPDWLGKFDIVYSNSFDHAIWPEITLRNWKDQLTPTGSVYLEYSEDQSIGNKNDPLDATTEEVKTMLSTVFGSVTELDVRGPANGIIFKASR